MYDDLTSPIRYKIFEEDLSRFNGVVVNSVKGTGFEEEFSKWMYNQETGEELHEGWTQDVSIIESKEWDKVVLCTFLP